MATEQGVSRRVEPDGDEILREVKRIVAELTGIASSAIHETDGLETELGCDSLDLVEIVMEVEDHFDVSVPDEVSEQIRTVEQIANGVARLLDESQHND